MTRRAEIEALVAKLEADEQLVNSVARSICCWSAFSDPVTGFHKRLACRATRSNFPCMAMEQEGEARAAIASVVLALRARLAEMTKEET
jgi:hypothetical protein